MSISLNRRKLLRALAACGLGATLPLRAADDSPTALIANAQGGYRFLPGSAVFAGGAIANDDHEMVHVLLRPALPLAVAYAAIERYLTRIARPLQALAGMELRIPQQLSLQVFAAFNQPYVEQLRRWELFVDGHNPVSRVNVAPSIAAPTEASLHAFTYCAPRASAAVAAPCFVLSGIADVGPGGVIARGDTSIAGMRARLAFLIARVEEQLTRLGVAWRDITQCDLHAAHDVQALAYNMLLPRLGAAASHGMRWYPARPPIAETECELDVRAVYRELVLDLSSEQKT